MLGNYIHNKVLDNSKGFYSLLLALLLIFSISGKSVATTLNQIDKPSKTEVKSLNKDVKFTSLDLNFDDNEDLAELDLDDLEEFISFNSISNSAFIEQELKTLFFGKFSFRKLYKQPLYILYCNWKFHLS